MHNQKKKEKPPSLRRRTDQSAVMYLHIEQGYIRLFTR